MSCEDIKFYETVENGIVHLEDLHYAIPLPFTHQNIVMRNTSRITAAICLNSSPKDMLARWMRSSKVKSEETGIYHSQKPKVRVRCLVPHPFNKA